MPPWRIAQEAVDDDARRCDCASRSRRGVVVGQEAAGRLAVGVEDADLLVADLGQLPVRRVVPGPERAVGEARSLLDDLAGQLDAVRMRAAARDELLDAVDDARERAPRDGDASGAGLGLDTEDALRQRSILAKDDGRPVPAVPPLDARERLPQASRRVPMTIATCQRADSLETIHLRAGSTPRG